MKFHIENKKLIFTIDEDHDEVVCVPDGVEIIGHGAFRENHYIQKIIIPPTVQIIEERAFMNCDKLQSVDIPALVKEVKDCAFANCTSLFTLTTGLTTLFGRGCFSNCINLSLWKVPNDEINLKYFSAGDNFAVYLYSETVHSNIKIYKGRFSAQNFPVVVPPQDSQMYYFASIIKDNKEYFYYSTDKQMAIDVVSFLAYTKTIHRYFGKDISFDDVITPKEFVFITGLCYEGTMSFLKHVGIPKTNGKYKVSDIFNVLGQQAPGAARRFEYALNNQNIQLNLHDRLNGMSLLEAVKDDIGNKM